ncbi:molybdate ABC transporter substrate-binding protein [Vibrio sp. WXL210]|uniref:molybdate ABC transporter substrate-binding protein n=1 Tax=Vibrio sp. WXL210 TaxID=3450709 RepID=UPI003EC64455
MNRTMTTWLIPGLLLAAYAYTTQASANESPTKLQVITSGGFAAAFDQLKPEFEALTGIQVETSYGSSSGGAHDSIPVRLEQGEQFDVIILSRSSLDKRTDDGFVYPDTRTDLVTSMIGMSVKSGAPKPDISTPEAFIKTLNEASSIGYSASASGTYLSTKLWPEMGIWQDIEAKSTRVLSERVATVVARGELEIGFQQVSEILPIEGADYVGPIPDEYQKISTFSAGVLKSSSQLPQAAQLIDYLSSPKVVQTIEKTGLFPVIEATNLSQFYPQQ